jgi:hypothetical protein
MRAIVLVFATLAASCSSSADLGGRPGTAGPTVPVKPMPPGQKPPGCGLDHAAFCETFESPSPGGRAGDLDDNLWSMARIATMGDVGVYQQWKEGTESACGKTTAGIKPGQDITFCAGGGSPSMHMNDTENDGGGFTIHSYRPRQMFDFTDRTGTIAFDVGGKGQVPGGHGFWFNISISEEPVPAPYQEGGAIALFAKNAVLLEFEAGGGTTECKADGTQNGLVQVIIEKDYCTRQSFNYLVDRKPTTGCFSTVEEVLNHIEIQISQSTLDVFASDAGDPASRRNVVHLDATTDPAQPFHLPFSKGYISFQQTHYNGNKCWATGNAAECGTVSENTTYHWDNVGFDGPVYPTPRAYQVPDSNKSYVKDYGSGPLNLTEVGYQATKTGLVDHDGPAAAITLANVDLGHAVDASLTLNAWNYCPGESIGYRFNGGPWRSYDCPFPPAHGGSIEVPGCGGGNSPIGGCDAAARAVIIPVALDDLKSGDNTLEINSSAGNVIIANADLTIDVSE